MNWLKSITLFAVLLTAMPLFGDEASNQFSAAKTVFDNGQYESARSGFDAFLLKYPTHVQATAATFYLAESLMHLRQYSLAEASYNRLVTLGLNDQYARAALFRIAEIPYMQGQFDIAKPRLEDFVEKLSQDANLQFVLYYLGDIAMRSNLSQSVDEAEWYFGLADRMFPEGDKNLESKLGLAWAKNKLGKVAEADAIYAQLMNSIKPAVQEQAIYQYGTALFERGTYQNAINALTDFQHRYPASPYFSDSQRVIARCYGRLNNFEVALQTLSQIVQPTPEDLLLKVRCYYGLKKIQDAKIVLEEVKHVAGTNYRDEIALLESVFLSDQKDWGGTIALLESVLRPQYDAVNKRMSIPYLSTPLVSGKKLSEENFFRCCSLLAVAYATNRQTEQANALLLEMQGQAALSGNLNLTSICTDTANKLASVTPSRGNVGSFAGRGNNNQQQWSPSTGQSSGNRNQNQSVLTTGTDLEKFWRAEQLYRTQNYAGTVQQLEQILFGFYNQISTPKVYIINYNITGAEGSLSEITFVRACSLLTLSKAQLGDVEQASAVLATLASRIRMNDSAQVNLLQETNDQLATIARGSSRTTSAATLLSDAEQRRLLREANSFFRNQRYDQADAKLSELIASNPAEAVLTEALFTQAKTAYKLGKELESIKILERITDEFPTSAEYSEVLWTLGLYHESGGDTFQSVEYFQTLADKFPNFKDIDGALYFLAMDDLMNGNGRTATTYLTRVHRNHRNGLYWSHAVWTLAYEAYKKKQYAQAETYIREILRNSPDVAILDRVLYLKGDLALRRDDYQTAFLAFKEVIVLCKDSPLAYHATDNARIAATKAVNVK